MRRAHYVSLDLCVAHFQELNLPRTERVEHLVGRYIIPVHFPELKKANGAIQFEVAQPYIDYACIGDFAASKPEWLRIRSGEVRGARPSRSWRCPDGWSERSDTLPLPPSAEAYIASLPNTDDTSMSTSPAPFSLFSPAVAPSPGSPASPYQSASGSADEDFVMTSAGANNFNNMSVDPPAQASVYGSSGLSSVPFDDYRTPYYATYDTVCAVMPSRPRRYASYLDGPTGQLYDHNDLPLNAEETFGLPMDMLVRRQSRDDGQHDLFSLAT